MAVAPLAPTNISTAQAGQLSYLQELMQSLQGASGGAGSTGASGLFRGGHPHGGALHTPQGHGGSLGIPLTLEHGGHGKVTGPGDGRDDLIPTMLSNSEYVIPAACVQALGRGSSDAGADVLDQWVAKVLKDGAAIMGALPLPKK